MAGGIHHFISETAFLVLSIYFNKILWRIEFNRKEEKIQDLIFAKNFQKTYHNFFGLMQKAAFLPSFSGLNCCVSNGTSSYDFH